MEPAATGGNGCGARWCCRPNPAWWSNTAGVPCLALVGQLMLTIAVTFWRAVVQFLKFCASPVWFAMRQLDAVARHIDTKKPIRRRESS